MQFSILQRSLQRDSYYGFSWRLWIPGDLADDLAFQRASGPKAFILPFLLNANWILLK